jgi:hypothetical protein
LVEPTGSSPGTLSLNFTADSAAFDYLGDTEVVTLAYTLERDEVRLIRFGIPKSGRL